MANLIGDLLGQVQGQQQPANTQGLPTSMNDPKAAFMQLCKEKMVNPMDVFNRLSGGM